MLLTEFDLFGHPVAGPQVVTPPRRRVVSQAAKRAKLARHLEKSNNLVLFDELLDFLKAPLLMSERLASSKLMKMAVRRTRMQHLRFPTKHGANHG